MSNFTQKLRKDYAAPLAFAITFLPSGEVMSQPVKPDSVTPAVAQAVSKEVRGKDFCIGVYPSVSVTKDKKVQPYNGFVSCGNDTLAFDTLVVGLSNTTAKHLGHAPENIDLEFHAGTPQAQKLTLSTQKISEVADELMKQGLGPESGFHLILDEGKKNGIKVDAHPTDIIMHVTAVTLNAGSVEKLVKFFRKKVDEIRQEQMGPDKPAIIRT
jgi:hypothetical protein